MARESTPRPNSTGAQLTALRTSNASGRHDSRPNRKRTRTDRRRAAIKDASS